MFKMTTKDGTVFIVEGEDAKGVVERFYMLIDGYNTLLHVDSGIEKLIEGQGRIESRLRRFSGASRTDHAAVRKDMKALR